MKSFTRYFLLILYFFIGYTFVFGFLVFNLPLVGANELEYDVDKMLEPRSETTHAYLLEDGAMALDARLAVINDAQFQVNVSYYTIHGGMARDVFFGALLSAADNGVDVRLILDDLFYYQTRDDALSYDALAAHENITFKFYEPYNPFIPQTLQNRLHDKIIMVDNTYGIIGGRNIGDRYFKLPDSDWAYTHDLDVLVFGEEPHPTVQTMNTYYDTLFSSAYSHTHSVRSSATLIEEQARMMRVYTKYTNETMPGNTLDEIYAEAIAVDNASFVHGPLHRMHKDPVVLRTLTEIADHHDQWFVLSPYIIFSPLMQTVLPDAEDAEEILVLTNSPALSPNIYAMSGYVRYREALAARATVYEYQGEHALHGKAMTFGDTVSVIGTLNLDPRSATLSTESVLVIHSEAFTRDFHTVLEGYFDESLMVNADGSYRPDATVDMVEMSRNHAIKMRIMSMITRFFNAML